MKKEARTPVDKVSNFPGGTRRLGHKPSAAVCRSGSDQRSMIVFYSAVPLNSPKISSPCEERRFLPVFHALFPVDDTSLNAHRLSKSGNDFPCCLGPQFAR
jgi:hypothetical protein